MITVRSCALNFLVVVILLFAGQDYNYSKRGNNAEGSVTGLENQ